MWLSPLGTLSFSFFFAQIIVTIKTTTFYILKLVQETCPRLNWPLVSQHQRLPKSCRHVRIRLFSHFTEVYNKIDLNSYPAGTCRVGEREHPPQLRQQSSMARRPPIGLSVTPQCNATVERHMRVRPPTLSVCLCRLRTLKINQTCSVINLLLLLTISHVFCSPEAVITLEAHRNNWASYYPSKFVRLLQNLPPPLNASADVVGVSLTLDHQHQLLQSWEKHKDKSWAERGDAVMQRDGGDVRETHRNPIMNHILALNAMWLK